MPLLLHLHFGSLAALDILNIFWDCYYNCYYCSALLLLHSFRLYLSLFIQMKFLHNILYFCTFLYNFLFIFIFSITHSDFNQKIMTTNVDIVFITQPITFFNQNLFKIYYGYFGHQVTYWSVVGWSVAGTFGRWWVGRWSVSQLVDGRW